MPTDRPTLDFFGHVTVNTHIFFFGHINIHYFEGISILINTQPSIN